MKNIRVIIRFILILFINLSVYSQSFFKPVQQTQINRNFISGNKIPLKYKAYRINYQKIKEQLQNAPDFLSGKKYLLKISLPDEQGNFQTYKISKSLTLPEELSKKTGIQTFRISGTGASAETGSLSLTPYGLFVAVYRTGKSAFYIQPVNRHNEVIVYDKLSLLPENFECYTPEQFEHQTSKNTQINDEILRVYRFAVGTTGEYSDYHIQNAINSGVISSDASDEEKKDVVLTAVSVTLDRVNSIYERDLGVTLSLISNEKDVIFLDPDTDPYDNDDIGQMASTNTDVLNNYLGAGNYDGGHLFSTYPDGGLSRMGVICGSYKADSVTGLSDPVGDAYDVDYVAHEIGHEFNCNHTFANSCNNNRNEETAVEPGSGSSIMGYAGVCSPNIQEHSDDYFHVISINEAADFISHYATCSNNVDTGNHAPEITVTNYGDVYIPKNTAFMLQATATDSDDDILTYSWEQTDPVTNTSVYSWYPDADYDNGPLFRSYPPSMSNIRYFPVMNDILNGNYSNTWEVLPGVNREMNFKVTVRDNHTGSGQTPTAELSFQVDENSGPFRITNMDSDSNYEAGSQQTITWDVAGTDEAPVNCENVDILFSTDNGETFPYTIADNIPNSGSAEISIPDIENTSSGRFMIKAHNNYFFDITKGKISVTDIENNDRESLKIYPNPSQTNINISFAPKDQKQKIYIYFIDVSGRIIMQRTYEPATYFMQNVNIKNLIKGLYLIQIVNGKHEEIKKIIIN